MAETSLERFLETLFTFLMALLAYLNTMIFLGLFSSLRSGRLLFPLIGIVFVLFSSVPLILYLMRDRNGFFDSFLYLIKDKKKEGVFTAVLLSLSLLKFSGLIKFSLLDFLTFSFRVSASLFVPMKISYSNFIGEAFSNLLFDYARWLFHLIWIYLISSLGYSIVSGPFKSISEKVKMWKEKYFF